MKKRKISRLVLAAPQAAQDLTALGDRSRLQVGRLPIEQGAKPQRVGEQVARGIGKEMKR